MNALASPSSPSPLPSPVLSPHLVTSSSQETEETTPSHEMLFEISSTDVMHECSIPATGVVFFPKSGRILAKVTNRLIKYFSCVLLQPAHCFPLAASAPGTQD